MSTSFLKAVAGLSAIFVVFPVALFFALRWLARPLIRRSQKSPQLGLLITPVGYALYGCQVLYMVVCAAAYNLDPVGRIGADLHTPLGLFGALVIAALGFNVAAIALARIGYPPWRRRAQRDV